MSDATQLALQQQLDANLEHFDAIYEAYDSGTLVDDEDPGDVLFETPLEIKVVKQIRMLLTCGGPHIEARAVSDDQGIYEAHIVGVWGTTRLELPVPSDSGLYRALAEYAQVL